MKNSAFLVLMMISGFCLSETSLAATDRIELSRPVVLADDNDPGAVPFSAAEISSVRVKVLKTTKTNPHPGEFYKTTVIKVDVMSRDRRVLSSYKLEGYSHDSSRTPYMSFQDPQSQDGPGAYDILVVAGGAQSSDPRKVVLRFSLNQGGVLPPYYSRIFYSVELSSSEKLPIALKSLNHERSRGR